MGVPQFYLNALPEYRRDTLEFLLSLYEYVRQKERLLHQPQSALPPKCHASLSPDIGEAVRSFDYGFLQHEPEIQLLIRSLVVTLRHEMSTDIPRVRDQVLTLANEHLLGQEASPFNDSNLEFRDFLVHFVRVYADAEKIPKSQQDRMRRSVVSRAMIELKKLVEKYEEFLNDKDSESYIKFYSCVCALLWNLDSLGLGDFKFQVLGEVENVFQRNRAKFPGYTKLDQWAKGDKKPFLAGILQQLNQ